jgi:dipeptidyl aminopeptidase/acylaminoacyl peptidase
VAAIVAASGVAVAAADATAGAVQPPASAYFAVADMDEPVLSPDGQALAIRVRNTAGRRQLAVIDTGDLQKIKVIASYTDADVARVRWVGDHRLVLEAWDQEESAYGSRVYSMMAMDRDGANPVRLGGVRFSAAMESWVPLGEWVRTLDDGTGDLITAYWDHTNARTYEDHWTDSYPMRYDTRRGSKTEILHGKVPHDVQQWIFDATAHPRGAIASRDGDSVLLVPDGAGGWVERGRFPHWGPTGKSYKVLGMATDGRVYVTHPTGGASGGDALFRLDLGTGDLDAAPIVSASGYDIDPVLIEDRQRHKVIGVRFTTDAEGTAWLDDAMKAAQAKVDARLPGRINRVEPAACGCTSRMLVTSFSDRQPALYYLYDRADGSLQQIGSSRPAIDPRLAAETDFVRIHARDGHDLPVYVTRPRGKGPWPAVVLVHGGPYVRGWEWAWDGESQFLAAQGYVVIKPEFRGSRGFGTDLRTSGYRQWGLKMQDDIADATRWASEQGLADPARTCIAGASYGGYATLMGLVRYPELYRCGVAWAAVTDLSMMHDIYWSDMGEDYRDNGMKWLVGDPEHDAAQFQETSPLRQAARITRPLLLAHGGVDRRVPIEHAIRMRNALESAHAPVTWIEYKDEAHGWTKPETRIEFYQRMASFLAANIGPGAPVVAAAASR